MRPWVVFAALLFGVSLKAGDSLADALAAGRFQDALGMADSLFEAHPRNARLWTARGLALGGLGRHKEARLSGRGKTLRQGRSQVALDELASSQFGYRLLQLVRPQ